MTLPSITNPSRVAAMLQKQRQIDACWEARRRPVLDARHIATQCDRMWRKHRPPEAKVLAKGYEQYLMWLISTEFEQECALLTSLTRCLNSVKKCRPYDNELARQLASMIMAVENKMSATILSSPACAKMVEQSL